MRSLCSGPLALAPIMFAGVLHLNGQEQPAGHPGSRPTADRAQAIARVDQISERLRGMEWTPEVLIALSGLGTVACRHDQELGIRVFEKAYSVAAGIDFDLSEASSIHVLSSLAAGAKRCHSGFGFRSPTARADSSELEPQASFLAAQASLGADPEEAAGLFQSAAEDFSDLHADDQLGFVRGLMRLRRKQASEADAVFQHALLEVASSGSVADLFALGNYVFGPPTNGPSSIAFKTMTLPEGKMYAFPQTRSGIPSGLANLYIAASSEMLFRKVAPGPENAIAFGLTKQLEHWAQSNAPHQSAILASLLAVQRAQLAQGKGPSGMEARLRLLSGPLHTPLEEQLESASDELAKAGILFGHVANLIVRGELEGARELVADLEDEIRGPMLDIIDLKRTSAAIAQGDLEAARLALATLSDDLHVVLAALELASAYWNQSGNAGDRSDEDVTAAAEAIQLASAATARAPAYIRPTLRLAIARALALTERFEESILTLELAVHEFNADQESEERTDGALAVSVSEGGDVIAQVTLGKRVRQFRLLPLLAVRLTLDEVIRQLSSSPEPDLDRLEGVVARAVDPRLRALGLAAVAEGYLSKSFNGVRRSLRKSVKERRTDVDQQAPPPTGDQ